MVRALWVCGLLLTTVSLTVAQRAEVGFGLGTLNYTGDLVRSYNFIYSRPAGTVFYRSNLTPVMSFRTSFTGGEVSANDRHPIDPLSSQRGASFDIILLEASTVFEYHFLNWHDERRPLRFTPYLMGGIGLFGISGNNSKTAQYSNVQVAVPFGGGIKYVVRPSFYVSLEFGVRKTFFDYLDNVSDGDQTTKNYQYGNPNDNDAYYFLGFSLTHTFYKIPCPTSPYK